MESKTEINGTANQTLPIGKYTLIGVDVDTTGRRLIDEIVHLAAYTPNAQFGQHIMPVMNLNPAATQRHQIRVITIGFFRMLKNMQSYKFIKTKTEIAALRNFLDWLEERKKADVDSNGIVLLYHEQWKFIPYMILEAMKKYDLLDRFLNIVQYFANGYALAEAKCANTVKYYSLRQLSKVLLNQDDHDNNNIAKNNVNNNNNDNNENNNSNNNNNTNNNDNSNNNTSNSSTSTNSNNNRSNFEGSASVRAQLAYEIVQHLAKGEQESLNAINTDEMINIIRPYTNLTSIDVNELQDQNKCLDRQNSLRTIFVNYFKTSKYYRVRAVTFRRVLAENGYDLTTLQEIWCSTKKDGLKEVVSTMETLKPEEKNELADLLDCHFDPDKENVKPILKRQKRRMPRRGQRENGVNKGRNGHNNNVDSTVKSPVKKENDKLQQTSSSTKEIIEKKEHQEPELNKTEVAAVVAVN